MTVTIRIARALLVFVGATILLLVISAQVAPGWRPAPLVADLAPEALAPADPPARSVVQEQSIDVRPGIRAWALTPAGAAEPVPGVVFVAGAGGASRDALLPQARALAASGIAAIVYDKRRDGYSFFSRDYVRLANDAILARDVLAARPGVDSTRVGILGWSEGGWVAPLAVQRSPERFAFLAMVSPSIVTPVEQIAWTVDNTMASAPGWVRRVPATALAAGRPYLDYLDFDVRPVIAALDVPIFAIWGAEDATVPVATSVDAVRSASETPVTVRILAGSGHDVPAEDWAPELAEWMKHPAHPAADDVRGVEPASHLGVSALPQASWFTSPVLHLALTVGLAAASVLLPVRRHHRKGVS